MCFINGWSGIFVCIICLVRSSVGFRFLRIICIIFIIIISRRRVIGWG